MADSWEDMKRAKEEEYFQRQEREKLSQKQQQQEVTNTDSRQSPAADGAQNKSACIFGALCKKISSWFKRGTAN